MHELRCQFNFSAPRPRILGSISARFNFYLFGKTSLAVEFDYSNIGANVIAYEVIHMHCHGEALHDLLNLRSQFNTDCTNYSERTSIQF